MKILHINTVCGVGSTGKIAVDLAEYARNKNNEVYVAFAHGSSTYHNSIKFGNFCEQKAYAIWARLTGMQGLFGYISTNQLIHIIGTVAPDIVHLHNIHGNTLFYPKLFRYLKNKNIKIVWTLHDCWSFTGGCSHFTRYGCNKYKTECNFPCPHFKSWLPFYREKRLLLNFRRKRTAFTSINNENLRIVTVSNWLNKTVKQSFFKNYNVTTIYNWIDTETFQYRYDANLFLKYNLLPQRKYLVSVSALWSDTGTTKLNDALLLSQILSHDYTILLIGNLETSHKLPLNVCHIPYVDSAIELSKLYSMAFAYINLSVEDTFGKVIAEAMACGTPTIVFDSTACGEIVGEVGFKVPSHDVNAIVDALDYIAKSLPENYREKCVSHVKSNFSPSICLGKYLSIYNSFTN